MENESVNNDNDHIVQGYSKLSRPLCSENKKTWGLMDVFLFKYISNEEGLEILDAWKLNPGILWGFLNFINFSCFMAKL